MLDQLLQLCDKDDEVLEFQNPTTSSSAELQKNFSLSLYLVPVSSSPSFTMKLSVHWIYSSVVNNCVFQ